VPVAGISGPAVVGVSDVVGVLLLAFLIFLCQCCCQRHCLASFVAGVSPVACILQFIFLNLVLIFRILNS
jgi:hypothetical protein